jgi:DNA-binding transcriptional regulator PaaX
LSAIGLDKSPRIGENVTIVTKPLNTWLLFVYKVPNEPSARRVYVWRKLKAMGAVLLQDSVWILPSSPRTQERLEWLVGEVRGMPGGEATLWESKYLGGRDEELIQQFTEQVDQAYREILSHLQDRQHADLGTLSRQYQQAAAQDYFHSRLGQKVRAELLSRRD